MRNTIFSILGLVMVLLFFSCSSDDDSSDYIEKSFTDTWTLEYLLINNEPYEINDCLKKYNIVIRENNTGVVNEYRVTDPSCPLVEWEFSWTQLNEFHYVFDFEAEGFENANVDYNGSKLFLNTFFGDKKNRAVLK
ncbi:hypothetical protein [Aureivirga sp. CE67]|uniref:hypothetical protein n=1 Tax=Aureivirga sp. CE67 TaxID=1788983 RepID=UPI0018CAB028|nr:hypothetical protein [Aureivirga sp. CE67]